MSIPVQEQVWKLDLQPAEKLVLLKFAWHAGADGGNSYPSIATIATACSLTPRHVRRIRDELMRRGFLERAERHDHGRHLPAIYRVTADRERTPMSTQEFRASGHRRPPRVDTGVRREWTPASAASGHPTSQEPSIETPSEPNIEPSRALRAPQPPPTLSARATRALNGSRRKRDVDALETESPDDRYFRGRYGSILRRRLEEGERDAM